MTNLPDVPLNFTGDGPRDWAISDVQMAANMWRDGRSTSEIARAVDKTKNAVLGLMSRNREIFPKRGHDYLARPVVPARSRLPAQRKKPFLSAAPPKSKPVLHSDATQIANARAVNDGAGLTLCALTPSACRFPINTPAPGEDYKFCGRGVADRSAALTGKAADRALARLARNYCADHAKIAKA